MRPLSWLTAGFLLLVAVGCGGSEDAPPVDGNVGPVSPGEAAEVGPTVAAAAAPQEIVRQQETPLQPPRADAPPEEIVRVFLEATRRGNDEIASSMLSRKAIEETARRGLSVQPPGSPTMQYSIGRAEKTPNGEGSYVQCLWTDANDEGEDQFEVVWLLHPRAEGWRITGMATQMSPESDPILIDFEQPEGLAERIGGGTGVAEIPAEPAAETAQQPSGSIRQ